MSGSHHQLGGTYWCRATWTSPCAKYSAKRMKKKEEKKILSVEFSVFLEIFDGWWWLSEIQEEKWRGRGGTPNGKVIIKTLRNMKMCARAGRQEMNCISQNTHPRNRVRLCCLYSCTRLALDIKMTSWIFAFFTFPKRINLCSEWYGNEITRNIQ